MRLKYCYDFPVKLASLYKSETEMNQMNWIIISYCNRRNKILLLHCIDSVTADFDAAVSCEAKFGKILGCIAGAAGDLLDKLETQSGKSLSAKKAIIYLYKKL